MHRGTTVAPLSLSPSLCLPAHPALFLSLFLSVSILFFSISVLLSNLSQTIFHSNYFPSCFFCGQTPIANWKFSLRFSHKLVKHYLLVNLIMVYDSNQAITKNRPFFYCFFHAENLESGAHSERRERTVKCPHARFRARRSPRLIPPLIRPIPNWHGFAVCNARARTPTVFSSPHAAPSMGVHSREKERNERDGGASPASISRPPPQSSSLLQPDWRLSRPTGLALRPLAFSSGCS